MRNHHHHPHNNPSQHNNQSGAPRAALESPAPLHEAVAGRAYEMWVQQGRPENCDEANWLEAEGQLIAAQHRV